MNCGNCIPWEMYLLTWWSPNAPGDTVLSLHVTLEGAKAEAQKYSGGVLQWVDLEGISHSSSQGVWGSYKVLEMKVNQ
jgi:hypothetical protein